jgi:hypothetical protein
VNGGAAKLVAHPAVPASAPTTMPTNGSHASAAGPGAPVTPTGRIEKAENAARSPFRREPAAQPAR